MKFGHSIGISKSGERNRTQPANSVAWKAKGTWLSLQSSVTCRSLQRQRVALLTSAGNALYSQMTTAAEMNCGSFHHPLPCFHGHCAGIVRESFRGKWKKNSDNPHCADRNVLHSVIYVAMKNEISQHFIFSRKVFFFFEILRWFRVEANPKFNFRKIRTKMYWLWSRDFVFKQVINTLRSSFRWWDYSVTSPTGGTWVDTMKSSRWDLISIK
jgi:hypothetical protein